MKVSSGKEDVVGCNFVPNFSLLLPEENSKPLPVATQLAVAFSMEVVAKEM